MNRQMAAIYAVVTVVLGGLAYFVVHQNQAELLTLTGKFANVRLEKFTDNATLVILDLTVKNPAKVHFEINNIEVHKVEPNPDANKPNEPPISVYPGGLLTKEELTSYMDFHKIKIENPPLLIGQKIAAGQTRDGEIGVRFELSMDGLKGATIRVRFRD
ncbi:MAG: hypothetical protein ABI995_09725, partial [Acidobacteriota bacterium]